MMTDDVLKQLSPEALAALGAQQIAYVKPALIDGQRIYEVHAADGEEIARFTDRDVAFVVCRQNELQPLSVH